MRPSERFTAEVSVADLGEAIFGWNVYGNKVKRMREDGSYSTSPHARLYQDEDGDRIQIFGDSLADECGVGPEMADRNIGSFGLVQGLCGGDFYVALDVITRFRGDVDGLVAFLREHDSPAAIDEAVSTVPAVDDDDFGTPGDLSYLDQMDEPTVDLSLANALGQSVR